MLLSVLLLATAAAGLAIREGVEDSSNLLLLAVGYEAQFTVATFLNALLIDVHYAPPFDYFNDLVNLLVVMAPRDLLALVNIDKDAAASVSNFARYYVENKGGQLVLTSAYAAMGVVGVAAYALLFGCLIYLIDVSRLRYRLWMHSVAITYLWVLVRKDLVMAFKYYFTGLLIVFLAMSIATFLLRGIRPANLSA